MNNFIERIPAILRLVLATAMAVVFIVLTVYFMAFILAFIAVIALIAIVVGFFRRKKIVEETYIVIEHVEHKDDK